MEFRILVETRLDDRILERELVSRVERSACGIGPEEIGLTLEEGKLALGKVQARIVQTQADVLGAAQRRCLLCGRNQRVKDLRTRTVRTVFGTVQVSCRRYLRCNCQGGSRTTVWPLHDISCRGPRRSFNISTPAGAARCRIAGLRRRWANCFPLVIEASHTQRCVAIHSPSADDSISE